MYFPGNSGSNSSMPLSPWDRVTMSFLYSGSSPVPDEYSQTCFRADEMNLLNQIQAY